MFNVERQWATDATDTTDLHRYYTNVGTQRAASAIVFIYINQQTLNETFGTFNADDIDNANSLILKPSTLIVKPSSPSAPSVACNSDPSSASVNSKVYNSAPSALFA